MTAAAARRRGFGHEVGEVLTHALAADNARRHLELTERQFQDQIVELARRFDWLVVHHGGNQHRRAYYDTTGFPDLLMVGPSGAVLFRELKTERAQLTAAQELWRDRLVGKGADWALWRPSDWPAIVAALSDGKAVAQ